MARKYSRGASRDVKRAMRRRKRGPLKRGKGGRGGKVKSRRLPSVFPKRARRERRSPGASRAGRWLGSSRASAVRASSVCSGRPTASQVGTRNRCSDKPIRMMLSLQTRGRAGSSGSAGTSMCLLAPSAREISTIAKASTKRQCIAKPLSGKRAIRPICKPSLRASRCLAISWPNLLAASWALTTIRIRIPPAPTTTPRQLPLCSN